MRHGVEFGWLSASRKNMGDPKTTASLQNQDINHPLSFDTLSLKHYFIHRTSVLEDIALIHEASYPTYSITKLHTIPQSTADPAAFSLRPQTSDLES
jgi:hypothetical protein